MEGRVGKHDAKKAVPRGYRLRHGCVRPPAKEKDRPSGAHKQPLFFCIYIREGAHRRGVPRHEGERLLLPVLAGAEGGDRLAVFCPGREVVSA
jgi:hypothetical protein